MSADSEMFRHDLFVFSELVRCPLPITQHAVLCRLPWLFHQKNCETLIREVCVAEHLLLAAAQQTGRRVKDFVPRQIGSFGILGVGHE
jgi:hypothetical protein